MRFVDGTFPDAYDTTIEDYHMKQHTFLGKKFVLKITDTAGQVSYSLAPFWDDFWEFTYAAGNP